jgi:hypothetical protein
MVRTTSRISANFIYELMQNRALDAGEGLNSRGTGRYAV